MSFFFTMNLFLYKIIVVALTVTLLFTSTLAVISFSIFLNRPELPDGTRLAYEQQICNLQEKLNHPSCFIDGKIIYFDITRQIKGNFP